MGSALIAESQQPIVTQVVTRDLVVGSPPRITGSRTPGWSLEFDGTILSVRTLVSPSSENGRVIKSVYEVNKHAIQLAIHLIGAGIWLADESWGPWFESVAEEMRRQFREGSPSDYGNAPTYNWRVETNGSQLGIVTTSGRFNFDLYPTSEHPNGDATVKWIQRGLLPAIEKEQQ